MNKFKDIPVLIFLRVIVGELVLHTANQLRKLKLCYRVADCSDANKMTASNLAIVFGPTLLRKPMT